ncbi:MAG: PTS sugar transporter subunit IIA [Planctomycetales bacterium]|nr:PTS sugar transporter subunit IIA [Planctomycetales bacterium]
MKLTDVLRSECIRVGSMVDDKAMALCEIAALAKKSRLLNAVSEEAVLEALQERETLGTTAFGHGIAIPHCRMRGVRDFVVGLMTVPNGVEFESEDGKKVHLIVFIIAPLQQSNQHIRLLSVISQALQDAAVVKRMIKAKTDDELKTVFLRAAAMDVSEQIPAMRNQIHVFVQDDKVFRDILAALSGLDNVLLSIVEGTRSRSYLSQSPLYADFSGSDKAVCKIIVAIVERTLSNEVIRRIEGITGSLFECTGVMVTVQELTYSAGSLEV